MFRPLSARKAPGAGEEPFTHLHVASGYSMRYGVSTPKALVEAAAAQGMTALALTDRDGLYGAVKFVKACASAGVAPILGVDLAIRSEAPVPPPTMPGPTMPRPRTPVRGGVTVDQRYPRITVLALGADQDRGLAAGQGWAALCRLVSATHLAGDRGAPVTTAALVAEHGCTADGVPVYAVLLGPHSDLGRAVLARRPDVARAILARWRAALPPESVHVEIVCHRGPREKPGSLAHAARMLAFAREERVPAVLTNAVRHATPDGAATADLLDAARRLVALDTRHVDRVTAAGYLAPPAEMAALAREITHAAGAAVGSGQEAARLLGDTAALARRCRLDLTADLGMGVVHLPEPEVLGLGPAESADAVLRKYCDAGISQHYPSASGHQLQGIVDRLELELAMIATMGFASYFLTVREVCSLIRQMGVRVAARGSGAGSLVNYLIGISGIDPVKHDLMVERFLSPLRAQLPDIDVDVESARRTEVYEEILARFGAERVTCVSMMDTYRVRHAIRDVGAALGMPPSEVDEIAKAFPHIRARDVRLAISELPELRRSGLGENRLDLFLDLVQRLDGLPRHVALHPCGIVLSDAGLLDRTPIESSWMGFPMSQFDKDDVEDLGLLKLDVLGIRMQSAMAYAVDEVARVDGPETAVAGGHPEDAPYLDPVTRRIDLDAVPHDDGPTFELVRSARTLGCFQIESPGQRELVGKFAPETFADLIIDISLFRPGPVKSDMVTPFLRARQGWDAPEYTHPSLEPILKETWGVVVFHEQILKLVSATTGCSLAEADEFRRAMGSPAGQAEVEEWWRERARGCGYDEGAAERIWSVLTAFASFGFCKAHAAAFALPTYQSAWLKAHHPAAFLAGVLTHDPGMYPKRLILEEARRSGIAVLGLDVNRSDATYRVERLTEGDAAPTAPTTPTAPTAPTATDRGAPDTRDGREPRPAGGVDIPFRYGIRIALGEVKGITDAEVARIVAGRPYADLADFWHRAGVSRPVAERLVVAGGFDALYGTGELARVRARRRLTRRDLLLQVAELDRWSRAARAGARKVRPRSDDAVRAGAAIQGEAIGAGAAIRAGDAIRAATARQSKAPRETPDGELAVQLPLDLADAPDQVVRTGLPEMNDTDRLRAELDVLGLDASRHVVGFYTPLLDDLGVTRSVDLLNRRSGTELLVAGVKVATQTPPVRSGRRVVFLTLDDMTGPVDATFFEDVQGPCAGTVFHSWLLVVRGLLRRTGPRGVSLRATGAWAMSDLWQLRAAEGMAAVHELIAASPVPEDLRRPGARPGARPGVGSGVEAGDGSGVVIGEEPGEAATGLPVGDRRRVLVHASGFRQSPYADIVPAGESPRHVPRKLWHSSPGSSGH